MLNPLNWLRRSQAAETKPHGLEGRLNGYYRADDTTVTGWVSLQFLKPRGVMDIEFRCDGKLVASCKAPLVPEHERFEFSLPIGPWLRWADLLDDTLEVHVISDFGATGKLLPDGPTQLRAIRDAMVTPADVVLELDFGRDGNARPHLGDGWWASEPDATWTNGPESVVRFDAPTQPGNYALRILAGAYVTPPDVARQEAEVLVNDTYLTNFVFLAGNEHRFEARIPFNLLAGPTLTTLRFRHLYAVRPSDLGKPDKRLLAMRFRRLSVVRLTGMEGQ